MQNLLNMLKALGPVRIATLAVALVLLLGLFTTVITRVNQAPMALLYGGVEQAESSKIASFLDGQGVKYEVRGEGSIYVSREMVGELRLKVAGEGLVGSSIAGYEIFDKSSSFGTTSLVQNINARRALEGELVRTIKSLPVVQSARVHLVMPKKRLFSKEKVTPTASVTLNIGSRVMDSSTVSSIAHLVAASVPNMEAKHVTIVDQRGNLLSSGMGDDHGASTAIDANSKVRRSIEESFEANVTEMLERVVGNGKVNVSVNAEVDFDRIEETSELFDPDQQVVRSEQRSEGSNASQQSTGDAAVGVTGNVPGAGTTGTSVGSRENQTTSEETINYEISKTARHYIKESGGVKKLSVAVLVEGRYTMVQAPAVEGEEDAEPKMLKGEYIPYTDEDLEKFRTLVQTAIGFNAERGDTVQVIDMPFTEVEQADAEEPAYFTKEDYFRMIELGGMLIGMFLLVLVIIRPLMKAATKAVEMQQQAENAALLGGSSGGPIVTGPDGSPLAPEVIAAAGGDVRAAMAAIGGGGEDDNMIDVQNIEGKVKASSLKKVAELIATHPDESVAVIRNWMSADSVPPSSGEV